MAACLVETARLGIPQMRVLSTDIRLVFSGRAGLSSTRATSDSKLDCSDETPLAVSSSTRATGDRKRGMSHPRHSERRSSTRATCGPPLADHPIRNEGPAQPALRHFRASRKTMAHHSFRPPPDWGQQLIPMGRSAAHRRLRHDKKERL
jgi:hypothetical protein